MVYVRESLNPKRFIDIEENDFTEHVWCSISLDNENILVGNVYRSRNSTEENNEKLINLIKSNHLEKINKILITGDFNFPDINW